MTAKIQKKLLYLTHRCTWHSPCFHFRSDEFLLECPKLGRLERVRIGHDNTGFGPGWYLDKVTLYIS